MVSEVFSMFLDTLFLEFFVNHHPLICLGNGFLLVDIISFVERNVLVNIYHT